MRWPFFKKTTAILSLPTVLLVVISVLTIQALNAKPTFIRIIDQGSITRDTSLSPGADIRGVTLNRPNSAPLYVDAVVSFEHPHTIDSSTNTYSDTLAIIGDFSSKKNPSHLALTEGGSIIVRINASYHSGDSITVYEIGQHTGRTAEYYEVSVSTSENGPWEVLGTGAGETQFTIE
ncbi:MAG: hypothetical protein KIH62_003975 [Candidatus Kerfeldbacteria bacterium]|nr:hypothetical protein [Candidatus Kerfeldbacteria bacterium]